MSEANFKSLQTQHESLLQKQQSVTKKNQQEFTKEVREYIEQAKQGGSNIASTRERDQVRANLRYWANYIYGIEGVFPDTELAPSTVTNKRPVSSIITIIIFILLILFGAIQTFRSTFNQSTETPTDNPISTETQTITVPVTEAPGTLASATSTSVFVGSDVVFTSPENGENVFPKVKFEGAYTNLKSEDSIHILIIREDKLFPLEGSFTIPQESTTGTWDIEAKLYRNSDELQQAENLIVVPAACFDQSCRDKLANAVQTGLAIDALPSQLSFSLYRDSSRVLYRNAYQAIQETRVVYSIFYEGATSVDLYTSKPDGSDAKPIKLTPIVSEISPNLSPDGTKIVYVKRFKETNGDGQIYAIAIMDSNGENDVEITERTKNVLENPQWSPDASYISYAMGDTSQSSIRASWNIHICEIPTQNDGIVVEELHCAPSNQNDSALFEEPESFVQPYHTWLPDPDKNSIVFEARPQTSGTSGFDIISIDSSDAPSHYFDVKEEDDIQPSIKPSGNGYLLTFTTVDHDKNHNIYAVLVDSNQPSISLTNPIRLTNTRAGEIVDGEKIAQADFPIPDPNSNWIYYVRRENIYRVEFKIEENKIVLSVGANRRDGEQFGDLVIETGLRDQILGFDVGFMEAFFPIP